MTDAYGFAVDHRDLQRAEWAARLIAQKIEQKMAIVRSPVAHKDDVREAAADAVRWTHYSRVFERHEDCGDNTHYCDNGGNSVTHAPFGCPDLEDLFIVLAASGAEGFDEDWLHTCDEARGE